MKNKEKQDSSYITFTDCIITDSSTSIITVLDTSCVNYTVNTNDWVFIDDDSFSTSIIYTDPYQELEETKQQQEKEEELREENSCLQEAWSEYQLILKLLEENECDKFLEERYGMNK